MTEQELRSLISRGESESLELKSSVPPADQIANILASMANTQGGVLAIGVKEPDRAVGANVPRAKAMLEAAQRYMDPPIAATTEVIELDGHPVVLAMVQKTARLVSASGGYYKRVGDRSRPLTAEEIRDHAAAEKNDARALTELASAVAAQTQTIDQLRKAFDSAEFAIEEDRNRNRWCARRRLCEALVRCLLLVPLLRGITGRSTRTPDGGPSLPDGHLKLPHLWPGKLLQAGRRDCRSFRLLAERLFGKRSASGRRRTPGSGGQATHPARGRPQAVLWTGGLSTAGECATVSWSSPASPPGAAPPPSTGSSFLELQQPRAVHQSIQDGRGHGHVAQVAAPVLDDAVGGHQHAGAAPIAPMHQRLQQLRRGL